MRKLTAEQLRVLRGIRDGCVEAPPRTLASLRRRGLVIDLSWGLGSIDNYFITDAGRDALKEATDGPVQA